MFNGESKRVLTSAGLSSGITKVPRPTPLTLIALGIVETLKTFAGLLVAAVWHTVVNVAVTHTSLTHPTRHQRVAVIVVSTSVAAHA